MKNLVFLVSKDIYWNNSREILWKKLSKKELYEFCKALKYLSFWKIETKMSEKNPWVSRSEKVSKLMVSRWIENRQGSVPVQPVCWKQKQGVTHCFTNLRVNTLVPPFRFPGSATKSVSRILEDTLIPPWVYRAHATGGPGGHGPPIFSKVKAFSSTWNIKHYDFQ